MPHETNRASSELCVLSALCRLGTDATVALSDETSVDVVAVRQSGNDAIVDLESATRHIRRPVGSHRHFLAFVNVAGESLGPSGVSDVWIVPERTLHRFFERHRGPRCFPRALLDQLGEKYRNKWTLLFGGRAGQTD